MDEVKHLGDTAAHDRTYITAQVDIDDIKARYRKTHRRVACVGGVEEVRGQGVASNNRLQRTVRCAARR